MPSRRTWRLTFLFQPSLPYVLIVIVFVKCLRVIPQRWHRALYKFCILLLLLLLLLFLSAFIKNSILRSPHVTGILFVWQSQWLSCSLTHSPVISVTVPWSQSLSHHLRHCPRISVIVSLSQPLLHDISHCHIISAIVISQSSNT